MVSPVDLIDIEIFESTRHMSLTISAHTDHFATAPQIAPEDMPAISAQGFSTVVNNRPDGEGGPDQPSSEAMAKAAQEAGLEYHYLPVISGQITPEQVARFAAIVAAAPGPLLAFCRSGARSTNIWRMGQ
jgi:uncharacterized protein (TIGR01244 family)